MACRNVQTAGTAAREIEDATRNVKGAGTVRVVRLDLGSLVSVRQCAQGLLQDEERIHLLVNNAGTAKFACLCAPGSLLHSEHHHNVAIAIQKRREYSALSSGPYQRLHTGLEAFSMKCNWKWFYSRRWQGAHNSFLYA
jgi:NAD(P)-dependent dehydrogenase (short-subunit alcohol dehydrogenase family)